MVPTCALPPPTPFTCHVTAVSVGTVVFESLTTATRVIEWWETTGAEGGESVTEVTLASPPLPPPQADRVTAIARASKEVHRADILILRVSRSMLTFCNLILSARFEHPVIPARSKKVPVYFLH